MTSVNAKKTIINEESTLGSGNGSAPGKEPAIHYFSQRLNSSMSLHGVIILQFCLVTPCSEILSTLAQVIAFCLTAPIHYLNQYWLIKVISNFNHSSSNNWCHTTTVKQILISGVAYSNFLLKALCPSDVIWRYRFGSILVEVMGWSPVGIKPLTNPMSTSWWRR